MDTLTISERRTYNYFFLPALFIVMWSSGYVVGKIGLLYTGPYTLIFLRFASAASVMFIVSLLTKAAWPKSFKNILHLIVVGLLVQGIQFSCLYTGMNLGVSAGVAALIVGITPILTAFLATQFFNEKVNFKQWCGAFLGLFGVLLVVLQYVDLGQASFLGYLFVFFALVGITIGTLYQKKFCVGLDLRTGGFIQLTAASILSSVLAWHYEGFSMHFGVPLILTTGWLSIINSIGAVTVWFVLMKRGEASKVSSLFHLIPGVTALMGYFVLNESLSPLVLTGFVITAIAVYMSH